MFTNARLFTIDKFTNARFDCISNILTSSDNIKLPCGDKDETILGGLSRPVIWSQLCLGENMWECETH